MITITNTTEFEEQARLEDVDLEEIFEKAKLSAKNHLKTAYESLGIKYESLINEQTQKYEASLESQRETIKALEEKLTSLELKLSESGSALSDFKNKIALISFKRQKHLKNNQLLGSCLHAWNRLTLERTQARNMDKIADNISKNFIKTRVFSRFGYNLVARNFAEEKRQYLESYNSNMTEMMSRYEKDVGELKQKLLLAETMVVKERTLRVRLEEDIRRMLLKNMTSMNVEAMYALKQPLLYPDEDDDQIYTLTYDDDTIRNTMKQQEQTEYEEFERQQLAKLEAAAITLAAVNEENRIPNLPTNLNLQSINRTTNVSIPVSKSSSGKDIRSSVELKTKSGINSTLTQSTTSLSQTSLSDIMPRHIVPVPTTQQSTSQKGKFPPPPKRKTSTDKK